MGLSTKGSLQCSCKNPKGTVPIHQHFHLAGKHSHSTTDGSYFKSVNPNTKSYMEVTSEFENEHAALWLATPTSILQSVLWRPHGASVVQHKVRQCRPQNPNQNRFWEVKEMALFYFLDWGGQTKSFKKESTAFVLIFPEIHMCTMHFEHAHPLLLPITLPRSATDNRSLSSLCLFVFITHCVLAVLPISPGMCDHPMEHGHPTEDHTQDPHPTLSSQPHTVYSFLAITGGLPSTWWNSCSLHDGMSTDLTLCRRPLPLLVNEDSILPCSEDTVALVLPNLRLWESFGPLFLHIPWALRGSNVMWWSIYG